MNNVMRELARPFPDKYIEKNPSGGGHYVKHHVIVQRLIQVLGVPPSFEKVEVIFGDVAAIPPNPQGKSQRAKDGADALRNVVVAVVARLTVTIDGQKVIVEEAGDCEEPHNWKTDGQRLKDAMSDAYKRCAMRLGVGLHLWSQDQFFLFDKLNEEGGSLAGGTPASPSPQASGEVAGEVLAGSANTEPQASLDVSPPADVAGGGGDESADRRGSGEEPGPASSGGVSTTVQQLINTFNQAKVMAVARRIAQATAMAPPLLPADVNDSLAALVKQDLEKVNA
jgi:Rad52/22 family double-strand break repair protein